MPGGYGFFTFGWIQAEREFARVDRFNERWEGLLKIHDLVAKGFVEPLTARGLLTHKEESQLADRVEESAEWCTAINVDINIARQNHLTRYATSIRKLAMLSIRLCQKHGVYSDIVSYKYDAGRKTIVVNGRDFYFVG